jgi:hypothetical protein
MTPTRIQDALLEVRDGVEVPPPDELAFRQHLRRARRNRAAGRAAVAAAAVVAIGVGPVVWLSRPAGSPPDPARQPDPAAASAPAMFPVSLDGKLETVLPDDGSYSTSQRVEEVIGAGPAGIVVVARQSHVVLVPLLASGQPGTPRDLGDGSAVQRAWLDKSGQFLGFVDLDHRLHVRAVGSDDDLVSTQLSPDDELLAVDSDRWLTARDGTVTLHTDAADVALTADAPAFSAEVAGGTVAYEGEDRVDFFDSSDGRHRAGTAGLAVGSLSPDGTRYVGAAGEQQRDTGASDDWYLVDTRTGERQVFAGRPDRAVATSMTWQDGDRFLVVGTDSRRPGNRIVWDCSVASGQCVERLDDPAGTVQIATR